MAQNLPAESGPYRVALRDPQPGRRGADAADAQTAHYLDDEDEEDDSEPFVYTPEKMRLAVGLALDEQAYRQLPVQYVRCVKQVLAAHDQDLRAAALRELRASLTQTIWDYTYQAGCSPLPAALVAQLTTLHRLLLFIEEALAEADAQRQPVEVHLKKKWRAELKTSLCL